MNVNDGIILPIVLMEKRKNKYIMVKAFYINLSRFFVGCWEITRLAADERDAGACNKGRRSKHSRGGPEVAA